MASPGAVQSGRKWPDADAFVWEQGVTTLIPEPPSNPLTGANAINLAGHIVGCLEEPDRGVRHATLWSGTRDGAAAG
jgi:uncharacterized membrane protein